MVSPRGDAVDPMLLPSGNSVKSHLNVLTMSLPVWGMLRRFRCVQSFLLKRLDGNIGCKDKKAFLLAFNCVPSDGIIVAWSTQQNNVEEKHPVIRHTYLYQSPCR